MSERSNIRLVVLGVLLISLIGTLVARLSYMQLVAGSEYEAQAANNSTREVLNPAVRGLILDQRGRPLVANRISLVVSVDRLALAREDDDGAASIANLAQALACLYLGAVLLANLSRQPALRSQLLHRCIRTRPRPETRSAQTQPSTRTQFALLRALNLQQALHSI